MLYVVATLLVLSAAAKGNVWRTLWALTNLIDTLRSLKEVRANGRRVGVTTRRKLIKQCLIGWIVFVAAQPVGLAADMLLFWFPFYKSLKSVGTIILIVWRLQTSGMIFDNFIVPILRRYEKHIDLTILLLHSIFALFSFFLFYLPVKLVRALLVAIGVLSDSSEGLRGGDDGDADTPPRSPTSSHATHTPSRRRSSLSFNRSPRSSARKPPTPPSSPELPKRDESKRKAPTKVAVSKTISERSKAFESAAAAGSSRKPTSEKAAEEGTRVAASKTATGRQRVPALPKPPTMPQPSSGTSTAAAGPPASRTTSRQTTRIAPSTSSTSKTEQLLNSLPAPPSDMPTDMPAPAPPVPHPRARRVNAPGLASMAQPTASAFSSAAAPTGQPGPRKQLYPSLPVSPSRKRPRSKATDNDSADRPVKRVASGSGEKPSPPTTKTTAATTAATAIGTRTRTRTTRVVSDSRKEAASTVPTTKRTRPATSSTATTTAGAPAKKTRTTRSTQ